MPQARHHRAPTFTNVELQRRGHLRVTTVFTSPQSHAHAATLYLQDRRTGPAVHPHCRAPWQAAFDAAADLQRHRRQPGAGVPVHRSTGPGPGSHRLRRTGRGRLVHAAPALPLSGVGQADGTHARLPRLWPGQCDWRVLGRRAGPAIRPRLPRALQEAGAGSHGCGRGNGAGQAQGAVDDGQPPALHPALPCDPHRPADLRRRLSPRPGPGHAPRIQGAFRRQAGLLLATVRRARLDQHSLAAQDPTAHAGAGRR
ncbi:hypothetical protein D3C76_974260 [compost metagenome]